MNAVILLAWLAGADTFAQADKPAPPPAKPVPVKPAPAPPVVYPPAHNGYHNGCDDCCDSSGHRLFGRLRGWFSRYSDDCCDNGHGGHRLFHRRHQDDCCDDGCGHKLFGWLRRWRDRDDCCDNGGHRLFGRLHGLFRRGDDCCPTDCYNGHGAAVIYPHPVPGKPMPPPPGKPPAGEKIGPPKDKKIDKKTEAPGQQPPATLILEGPGLNLNR